MVLRISGGSGRRYKKLLPALLYDAAVPSSCVALKSHVQTPPRRGRHRAEERRVSRGRGPRTDAHVVVMVVEDGTISVLMCIQWTNIEGKKQATSSSVPRTPPLKSPPVLGSARSPAAAGLPIPAEIRAVQLVMRYLGVELRKGPQTRQASIGAHCLDS